MQTIFVPLDFSDNSMLALRHAIELAKISNSTIIIFHSCTLPQIRGGSFSGRRKLVEIARQEAEDKMYKVVSELNQEEADLDFEHIIVEGDPLDKLLANADRLRADLIVMGTKGVNSITDKFLGSVSSKVIAESVCPVVVVPSQSSTHHYERIVYALSLLPESERVLNFLRNLARDLKTKLEVVHIESDEETAQACEEFMVDYQLKTKEEINFKKIKLDEGNRKVDKALITYLEQHPHTLMAMLRRERKDFWERMFGVSVTKKLALYAKSPLLILKPDNLI